MSSLKPYYFSTVCILLHNVLRCGLHHYVARFNLATDVQAHMPLWYILFTHIIASSSKLLPVLQRKTPTACYSPFLYSEEQKSSLFAVSRC